MSRLGKEAGVVYLEATRKNYGLARERLAELFRLADETVQSPPDDATKSGRELAEPAGEHRRSGVRGTPQWSRCWRGS